MQVYKSCPSCGAVLKVDSTANGALTCPKCKNKCHTRELKDVPSVTLICPRCRTILKSYVVKSDFPLQCRQCGYQGNVGSYGRYGADALLDEDHVGHKPGFEGNARDGRTEINVPQPNRNVVPHHDNHTQVNIPRGNVMGGTIPNTPSIYPRPLSLRLFKEYGESMWFGASTLPRLQRGRQIIGRIGRGADIECPTRDLYFSRTHFAVEVEYDARIGSHRHYLCNNGHQNKIYLKQVNQDWIEVKTYDKPIINRGDHIRVGHTEFEVFYDAARN